jgi:ADP-ribose pyrophosphatase YjhB (NUDIX family)
MRELRIRLATRALVLDEEDRVLLVRFGPAERALWATPGGGIEDGETDEQAIRRELLEETGLADFELGPHVWTRTAPLAHGGWDVETERIYLVRTASFDPTPQLTWDALREEGVTAVRWWTLAELEAAGAVLAPARLTALVRELLSNGPPPAPVDAGS